jgi:adenylyltransferase/sulfurtransferase
MAMEFTTVKLRWDPDCPVCGKSPTVTELIDYDVFCGLPSGTAPSEAEHGVSTAGGAR